MACSMQRPRRSFAFHRLPVGSRRFPRTRMALSHTVEPSDVPQPSLVGSSKRYPSNISIRSEPVFSPEWLPTISRNARTISSVFQSVSIQCPVTVRYGSYAREVPASNVNEIALSSDLNFSARRPLTRRDLVNISSVTVVRLGMSRGDRVGRRNLRSALNDSFSIAESA